MSDMTTETPPTGAGGNGDNGRDPERRRTALWVRIVLFISLALNLAVAGLVVGFVLKAPVGGPPPHLERTGGVLSLAMTDEERREIGRMVFEDMKANRPSRQEIRSEFAGIIATLRAEPFDKEAFSQSMSRQLQEAIRRQTSGQELLIDYIAEMSPQDRQAYADRLEKRLSRPPSHAEDVDKGRPNRPEQN